ncbi:MAG: uroporphyrinogen-III synthase [Microthrixaceae bacterium]
MIVIGDVAADEFEWFAGRPLTGRRIVVTRAPAQASRLTDRLLAAGADVINVPTIAIADPPDGGAALAAAAAAVSTYDWVVLTSPNGAERFLDAVGDARRLAGVRLAVIGPGTAAVLRGTGWSPT